MKKTFAIGAVGYGLIEILWRGNLLGQICPLYSFLWFWLSLPIVLYYKSKAKTESTVLAFGLFILLYLLRGYQNCNS